MVACEAQSHVARVEASSSAALSGVSAHEIVASSRGQLTADVVATALEPDPYEVEVVGLLALENTHQAGGGTVMPVEEIRAIRKVAQERELPVYLDGARIFNAVVADGCQVTDFT